MLRPFRANAAAVLAHGPWFDASLWHSVILPLQNEGLRILVAPMAFTSFKDDVQALQRTIERARGPLLVVAHSYAAAIASAKNCSDEKTVGRIYLSALAPPAGKTITQTFDGFSSETPFHSVAARDDGFIWANKEQYRTALAPGCMPHQWALLEATQRPIAKTCLQTVIPEGADAATPAWFLICEQDRVVPPSVQMQSANQLSGRILSKPVDHAAPLTEPDCVVEAILEAAHATLGRSR